MSAAKRAGGGGPHLFQHPHLHMFLFPAACRSPPGAGSLLRTGSCSPRPGSLRLEGGGWYLDAEEATFSWVVCSGEGAEPEPSLELMMS